MHSPVLVLQQTPVGCEQGLGLQTPFWVHDAVQLACVVTEHWPVRAQHEPVAGGRQTWLEYLNRSARSPAGRQPVHSEPSRQEPAERAENRFQPPGQPSGHAWMKNQLSFANESRLGGVQQVAGSVQGKALAVPEGEQPGPVL